MPPESTSNFTAVSKVGSGSGLGAPQENVALNRLLGKIRRQREDVSDKGSQLDVSASNEQEDSQLQVGWRAILADARISGLIL